MLSSLTQLTQSHLIHLRWLSIAAMLLAALISPNVLGDSELRPQLLAFAAVFACINACLHAALALRRRQGLPLLTPWVQLVFDLLCWAIFIYLSGGASNPLISVFLPLVAIGALALEARQAWLLGGAAIVLYSFLWRFHVPLTIHDAQRATSLHLFGMWLVFVVSTLVALWFIRTMLNALREREASLAAAREQALQGDWLISLGALAASAAHEMGTPLATAQLLVDEWSEHPAWPPTLASDLVLLHKQLAVCARALDHLALRASPGGQINQGSIDAWLQGVLHAWQGRHPGSEVRLEIAPALTGYRCHLGPEIERILSNLLDNARRAASQFIQLSATLGQDHLCIQVRDDGCGIPDAVLAHFASGQPCPTGQGMGIGLALGKAAVERAGGSLHLERPANGGTLATLILPLLPDPPLSLPLPTHEP